MSYSERERAAFRAQIHNYEATDKWKERAARFKQSHGWWCDACGSTERIDVHHVSYAHAFGGREPDKDLRALCRPCHEDVHEFARNGMSLVAATDQVIRSRHRKPARILQWAIAALVVLALLYAAYVMLS